MEPHKLTSKFFFFYNIELYDNRYRYPSALYGHITSYIFHLAHSLKLVRCEILVSKNRFFYEIRNTCININDSINKLIMLLINFNKVYEDKGGKTHRCPLLQKLRKSLILSLETSKFCLY